jgi:ribosomal-protein-alanine N-acetyltransferase
MVVTETARLSLRHLAPDDAPLILSVLTDADFVRNVGDRGARSIADARTYLMNGPIASYARFGHGLYLVSLKATGEPIGICGLLKRPALPDVDIGFALLPPYRGQGYATEAAAAVRDYARDGLGLARVVAIVKPGNVASIHVLEQIGMSRESTVRIDAGDAELLLFACAL